MNLDEKILIAASGLPDSEFKAEDIIVAAFQSFPEDFSLLGYPQYPDSNRVLTQITTAGRGLQRRGWLRKLGTKRYELTGEAHRHLSLITEQDNSSAGQRIENRDVKELLIHWLRSAAFTKLKSNGNIDSISEREALSFWKLSSGSTAARANREIALALAVADEIEKARDRKEAIQIRHDLHLSLDEADKLMHLHASLAKKFSIEIEYLRSQRR